MTPLLQDVLDVLKQQAVIVGAHGDIIAVNEAWQSFAHHNLNSTASLVGSNYLDVYSKITGLNAELTAASYQGISNVLEGKHPHFSLEYSWNSSTEQHWFKMDVSLLVSGSHYALVMHENITERKRADEVNKYQANLLMAQSEASPDGILVVSNERKWLSFNQRFLDIWDIPQHLATIGLSTLALEAVKDKLVDPDTFLQEIDYLYDHPDETGHHEVQLQDGRFFDRYSAPVTDAQDLHYGRVWFYRDVSEQRLAQQALLQSRHQLTEAIDAVSEGFALFDADDRLVTFNQKYRDIYLVSSEAIQIGNSFEQILRYGLSHDQYAEIAGHTKAWLAERLKKHRNPSGNAFEQKLSNGRWLRITESKTKQDGGVSIHSDFTELKAREQTIKESENFLRQIIDSTPDYIFVKDAEGRFVLVNKAMAERYGSSVEAMIGVFETDVDSGNVAYYQQQDHHIIQTQEPLLNQEYEFTHEPSGEIRWVQGNKVPLFRTDGTVSGVLAIMTDITQRKALEQRLERQVYYDALTGLANRRFFEQRYEQIQQNKSEKLVLMYMDLNRFKKVNDTLGHPIGDELLRQVAARLQAMVRARDLLARFGGDEFAVLLYNATIEMANTLAKRVIHSLNQPFELQDHKINVGVSIGVAVQHNEEFSELLRRADVAMYKAKAQGGGVHHYNAEVDQQFQEKAQPNSADER